MKEITLAYKHYEKILKALDAYSRFLCGQYDEISKLWGYQYCLYEPENFVLRTSFLKIREICIPLLRRESFQASLGIWNIETPLEAKRAFDIYQILRYQKSYHDYPQGGNGVNFNPPFIHGQWSIDEIILQKTSEITQNNLYPDYYPKSNRKGWACPLVIIEFDDEKELMRVLRDNEQIDSVINTALDFYDKILKRDLKESFKVLYPENFEDFEGILEEINHELNNRFTNIK